MIWTERKTAIKSVFIDTNEIKQVSVCVSLQVLKKRQRIYPMVLRYVWY